MKRNMKSMGWARRIALTVMYILIFGWVSKWVDTKRQIPTDFVVGSATQNKAKQLPSPTTSDSSGVAGSRADQNEGGSGAPAVFDRSAKAPGQDRWSEWWSTRYEAIRSMEPHRFGPFIDNAAIAGSPKLAGIALGILDKCEKVEEDIEYLIKTRDRGKIATQPYGELLADAKFYQTGCQTVSLAQRQHGIILEKLAAQGDILGAAAQYFERGLKENFQQVDIQVASSALRQAAAAGESQANYDLYLHGERLGLDAVTRQAHHDFWEWLEQRKQPGRRMPSPLAMAAQWLGLSSISLITLDAEQRQRARDLAVQWQRSCCGG